MNGVLQPFKASIGRSETCVDTLTQLRVTALRALLDLPLEGDVPPATHWTLFPATPRPNEMGRDGHPEQGSGLIPALPLPRRMWAGGQIDFFEPLPIGRPLTRVSRISDIAEKVGRSGQLIFVTLEHALFDGGRPLLTERQDLVFRPDAPGGSTPSATPPSEAPSPWWSMSVRTDPVLLFRYSALTYNGHRIHYDDRYARNVEGYPGLVVHGPLIATLLMSAVNQALPDRRLARFSFRAVSPTFEGETLDLCVACPQGDAVGLAAYGRDGRLAMTAEATLG